MQETHRFTQEEAIEDEAALLLSEMKAGGIKLEDAGRALDLLRQKYPAIVSVPEKYANDILEKGYIEPHANWVPGSKVIKGMIGREPYVPDSEIRRLFKIINEAVHLAPVMTGESKTFHGVFGVLPPRPLYIGKDIIELGNENTRHHSAAAGA